MEPTLQETSATPPSAPRILGTKIPAIAAFLIATLLFLLPFAEIRCNGTAIANNTGVGIATGSDWKEVVSKNIFGQSVNTNDSKREFHEKQDPNMFAIAALVLGVIGILIAISNFNGTGKIGLFIALLAAVLLMAMLIDLKSKAKSDTSVKSSDLDFNMGMKITVDGTAWFYLCMILFLTAAFFSWQRSKVKT